MAMEVAEDVVRDADKWLCEAFRLTVFGEAAEFVPDIEALFGIEPDLVEKRKALTNLELNFGNGVARIELQPGRVDWIWQPRADVDPVDAVRLGSPSSVIETYLGLFLKWLPETVYNRVAMGGFFIQQVEGKDEGYALVQNYLHELTLDQASSDFMYQINRPTVVNGVQLNRLTKWHVRSITKTLMQGFNVAPVHAVDVRSDVLVEVDINTVPDGTTFDHTGARERLHVLAPQLFGILAHGDKRNP